MKSLLKPLGVKDMNSLFTVIGFTFNNKFRSKSFIISSIIIAVLLTIGMNIPYVITQFSSDDVKQIGMFEDGSEVSTMLQYYLDQQEEKEFELVLLTPQASASANEQLIRKQLADGHIEGFLELRDEGSSFPKIIYKSEKSMDFSITSILRNVLTHIKTELAIQDLNISEEQRDRLFAPIHIESVQISLASDPEPSEKTEMEMVVTFALIYILIILFFMATMISGQLVASEITAEKSSRVMEILVTSVAPLKQMFGKIIGMFLLSVSQIVLFVVVFLANLVFPHNRELLSDFEINLSDVDPSLIVYFLLFYLLGYFLYATIFAAIGSIVSRTEDLGQAMTPITFLTLAVFYVGIFGINSPTSTFMTVTSFIPFFTPITMFIRIGMADPAFWEIALSFILLGATIFFMGWISAKIYRTGVLMYGKRPTIKEIRKAMKAFKVR